MKNFCYILCFYSFFSFATDSNNGPVYNFNFYNGTSNSIGPKADLENPKLQMPVNSLDKNDKSENISKADLPQISKKSYFSKSLLDPNDTYLGLILSTFGNVSKNNNKGLYVNFVLTPSLWGIKFAAGESNIMDPNIDRLNWDDSGLRYVKFVEIGVNKLIPLSEHFSIDLAGFYERGHDGNIAFDFKACDASIGLTAFSGNFMLGVEYKHRFAVSSNSERKLPVAGGAFNLSTGIYF